VEYHANGGGHANRRTSDQLSFEGSWILLDSESDLRTTCIYFSVKNRIKVPTLPDGDIKSPFWCSVGENATCRQPLWKEQHSLYCNKLQ